MWISLCSITMMGFLLGVAYHRYSARWTGASGSYNGIGYQFSLFKFSLFSSSFEMLGVEAPLGYDFVIKRETRMDRLFRILGISSKSTVGNAEFDEQVYVVSDNYSMHQVLAAQPHLQQVIMNILYRQPVDGDIERIVCRHGRMWACIYGKATPAAEAVIVQRMIPALNKLGKGMEKYAGGLSPQRRDRINAMAVLFLFATSAILLNGSLSFAQPLLSSFFSDVDSVLRLSQTNLPQFAAVRG